MIIVSSPRSEMQSCKSESDLCDQSAKTYPRTKDQSPELRRATSEGATVSEKVSEGMSYSPTTSTQGDTKSTNGQTSHSFLVKGRATEANAQLIEDLELQLSTLRI